MEINEEITRFGAAVKNLQSKSAFQKCLALDMTCPAQVIRAHSVQSSFILDKLVQDGHVYMFKFEINGTAKLALTGKNLATTFTGFCQLHDSELFNEVDFSIENNFNPSSKRQAILLSLRAISREYWTKLSTIQMYKTILNLVVRHDVQEVRQLLNTPSLQEEIIIKAEHFARQFIKNTQGSISRIQRLYYSLHTQIENDKYHLTSFRIFKVNSAPTLAVSSMFIPEFNLKGQQLNSLYLDNDFTDVVLTILPSNQETYALFSFHKRHSNTLRPLFNQMEALDEDSLKKVLSKMVLMHCENTVLAPRMVNSLTDEQRSNLEQFFFETALEDIPYNQAPDISLF